MDKAPNNKFPGNPGIMNDGRFFTDYRPKADVNAELNKKFLGHHHNDHLYRQYLTANGKNIIDESFYKLCQLSKCRNFNSQGLNELPGHDKCDDTAAYIDFVARPKNLM